MGTTVRARTDRWQWELDRTRDRWRRFRLRLRKQWYGVKGTLRVLRPVAGWLGPQFTRSPDCIEIDLTYACNLACYNCNRSVRQAPSGDSVTVEQVRRFLCESIDSGIRWRRIRLLGGEPTVHPQFFEILDLLLAYKRDHSPAMKLAVHTNGHGERVQSVLERIPEGVKIRNTFKTGNVNKFYPFNQAPRDSILHPLVDYSMGCRVPEQCGTGLTPSGYYPCAIAGAIDRVLGLDIGRTSLPAVDDQMRNELRQLCQWCGNFRRGGYNKWSGRVDEEVMSKSWRQAYAEYRRAKPQLTTCKPDGSDNTSSVDRSSMADSNDQDNQLSVDCLVDDPILANPEPP